MSLLTRKEFNFLVNPSDEPCVSIFMPTHRVGTEIQQDPIRLKNLVGQAEDKLINYGLRAPEARNLLEPARTLIDDSVFWQHQSDSLALLLHPDFFGVYPVPLNFEDLVVVANHFHLKPLLPLFTRNGNFYILALSQNKVRLWQATRYNISQIELKNVPASLAEALRYDDPEKQHQFHTATAASGAVGSRPAAHHGQGVGTDEAKTNLLRYFQQVDKGLRTMLHDESAPLVLACVEYLLPIYKDANSYPHLFEQSIPGNPDTLPAVELHKRGWTLMAPYFRQARENAAARYQQLAHTEEASGDLEKIVPAAYYGQVDTLFVAVNQQQWGSFDPEANSLQFHTEAGPDSDDLLDASAVQSLLHGGTVYTVEPDQMPDQGTALAIFRYPG